MIRRSLLAMSVLGLVTCGGDDATGPESVAGTYTLQSIDGQTLPGVILQVGTTYRLEFTAGSITLNQNTTCGRSFEARETFGSTVTTSTRALACIYNFISERIRFNWSDGSTSSGSIVGSQLTLTEAGNVFIFRK